jgi:hypothetical protein
MSLETIVVSLLLLWVVVRQFRGRVVTTWNLVWPVLLVLVVGLEYIHSFPINGNNLLVVIAGAAIGALLGGLCGAFTSLSRNAAGRLVARTTLLAALFWIVGISARLGFKLYLNHGGVRSLVQFDRLCHITSIDAWVAAALLMSLADVSGRAVTLLVRSRRLHASLAADGT